MKSKMTWMLAVCLLISGGMLQAALPVTDGLVMHLDAGALSAGPVAVWADQSGLTGNDAVQPDLARQPVYVAKAAAFANRPVVRFDGIDDTLDLNENMITVGSFTMFAVGQFDATQNGGNHYMVGSQVGTDDRLRICWDQAPEPDVFGWRVGNSANLPAWSPHADADAHVFVATSECSGYMDGVLKGTSDNTAVVKPTGLNLGMHPGGQSQYFKGDIAEVIVYNRVLTDAEREQVGIYLSNRYPTIETADRNLPHASSPADQAVGVLPGAALTWNAGLDPADLTNVNPAIKKHYVWMSSGSVSDPNLVLAATIDITNYDDVTADSVYMAGLVFDGTYSWMIEEGIDNGLGGTYPAGDPNNLVGPVWTFKTVGMVPNITVQPASVKVDAGQTAVLSLEYHSASSASAAWYKDGVALVSGGNITIATDSASSTLTIENAQESDAGAYYAIVTNVGGGDSEPSATAYLAMKKRLAWYKFEQNLNDAEGLNDASEEGQMQYAAGPISADGQAWAADPNGTNYGLLTTEAYPKAGYGNGLEEFTYSCWVKLEAGQGGVILGSLNLNPTTAIRFSVNGVENDISTYLRQEGGQAVTAYTPALSRDSQWHHVAFTYDGSEMKVFVDGIRKATATGTITNFVPWEYPMTLMAINGRGTIDQRFSGQLDDLQILNYALTKEQVVQQYLGVTGGWICDPEAPELVYDFDDNCQVDLGDLAYLAAEWLKSNRIYAQ